MTGGAGFIGSNVVDGYIREGHSVAVVDNLFTGKAENIDPSARFYKIDVRDEGIKGVFDAERPEIVNHHAAQISVPASVEDPLFDADVNIRGLLNVLECSRRCGVKKVIFISSGGAIYGEVEKIPTPEDYPAVPLSPYAISKLVSEAYLNFYKGQYGLDYTVLRYANVYGPRQIPQGEAGVAAIFMGKLIGGDLPTIYHYEGEPDGMQRDYCYVEDIVEANLSALYKGSGEAFNIGTGMMTRTLELYKIILGLLREKGYAVSPEFDLPLRGAARPGDLKKSCLDIRKAQKSLGFRPKNALRDGIAKTLSWQLSRL